MLLLEMSTPVLSTSLFFAKDGIVDEEDFLGLLVYFELVVLEGEEEEEEEDCDGVDDDAVPKVLLVDLKSQDLVLPDVEDVLVLPDFLVVDAILEGLVAGDDEVKAFVLLEDILPGVFILLVEASFVDEGRDDDGTLLLLPLLLFFFSFVVVVGVVISAFLFSNAARRDLTSGIFSSSAVGGSLIRSSMYYEQWLFFFFAREMIDLLTFQSSFLMQQH